MNNRPAKKPFTGKSVMGHTWMGQPLVAMGTDIKATAGGTT